MESNHKIFEASLCHKYLMAPIFDGLDVSKVLICEETNLNMLSAVKFSLNREVDFLMTEKAAVIAEIEKLSKIDHPENRTEKVANHDSRGEDRSVIDLIDDTVSEALRLTASDIHMEPFEEVMVVRYRLDGVLQQKRNIPKDLIAAVISRLKIMSGLDIAEKRRPQDGRIRFKFDNRTVDIRVSVLPTDFGEKIVLRLLDKTMLRLDLVKLGFADKDLHLFKEKIKLPNGIVLITGPTGSGKTTTLYAALNFLKSPGINITTIEDPIEYNLEGINQTQIKPEIDLTFASALRAILRQDPNVIMVGEIRDRETLDNALRASLTGHLVLSTVHTNDAISTLARLIDLGAENYLLTTTVKLIVAQRLIRLICPHCKSAEIDDNEIAAATALGLEPEGIRQGRGCSHCLNIGYRGRTAIYEMLTMDNETGRLLSDDWRRFLSGGILKNQGMTSLREKGLALIEAGLTTPSEVLRETG
ncbi:Type II secretion system protein E (fragment) [Candidatus Zixiibacteriota bacterium]